ncbi:hypothetical protein K474DRAFT_1604048 [Panus rudis PR-1116 ss-1]|nr:hypothetical protein K474DRAFT_1604048 [Panus rudis PR-1116 ss-1]
MFIYSGKLDWSSNAVNETITVVIPGGFAINDPVTAHWQWTVDANGNEKVNTSQKGTISTVTNTTTEYRFTVALSYYIFDSIVASDFSTLNVTMRNPSGEQHGPFTLDRMYGDTLRVPSAEVYTGKLTWSEYADNEMITFVVPEGVADGAPVGLYHQWTTDADGNAKTAHKVTTTFSNVATDEDGKVTGSFSDGYYNYEATILGGGGQDATILMSTTEDGSPTSIYTQETDHRAMHKKKALIMRFGTGPDNGIFLVQDMLTKYLGLDHSDVELSYFDIEPTNGSPCQCTKGQDPPTAANFKSKFTALLSSAVAGDVRFVYVDTHGSSYPDPDGSGEVDGNDEGWKFAGNNEGTLREVVDNDWVGTAIRDVSSNLTILTSSCMGGGMLDKHTATPGILLAGCHETQFNVKSLRTNNGVVDPWMYAVTSVIKKQAQRKRGVPTYTVLFNEAKKLVKQLFDGGQLIPGSFKGPSPDDTNPLPKDMSSNPITSNQDPQLIVYSGYVDLDSERFLFPFFAANGGKASGEATRYPHDEF